MAMQEHNRAASRVTGRSGRVALPGNTPEEIYSLRFERGGKAPLPDIEFHAASAYEALSIAHREGAGRSAELWRGEKKLCTLNEFAGSFWEIRPCAKPPAATATATAARAGPGTAMSVARADRARREIV